jgi:hypothetical protein
MRPAPKLVIHVDLEGPATPFVLSFSDRDEVRLLRDLEGRFDLEAEIREALDEALDILRERAAAA